MRASLVICTKDRPLELDAALRSVAAQTRLPDEVVVVDGSAGDDAHQKASEWGSQLPLRYLHVTPAGLTRQRNAGLRDATADLLLFMDDDSSLAPTYVAVVVEAFAGDPAGSIGAVLGRVVEDGSPGGPPGLKRRVLHMCQRLFLLPRPGPGTIQASGFQTLPHHLEIARDVTCLSGGAMSFRREALAGQSFDEALTGAGEMEDVDIARRLFGRTRIRYEPKAVVYHRPSAHSREPEAVRLGRLVRHHRRLALKYGSGSAWKALAFWWSVIGLFVVCLVSGRWASARAVAAAGLEAAGRERRI